MTRVTSGAVPLVAINALDMGKRSRGAAMGLLFYDHMITLDLEIELVWRTSKKRPAFYLYLFNRFFSFFFLIFDSNIPIASTDTGCYYHGILKVSAIFWIPGLVYEPILFLLVAYKAWPLSKAEQEEPRIPLITRMARDSLLYFIISFVILLASTIIWARAPTYINMVMPWSAALPSILGSRLLLNMREIVSHQGSRSYILETFGPSSTIPIDPISTSVFTDESELSTLQNST
ncbi:hypothetical protein QCA50_002448 [Cerrena zonata]|uniref:DUF6533 domain-containing protein n=1 Tax=Cerrena zonata TaxID=2478898 RepID=A0AAW0GPD4_9APHY